MGSTCCMGAVHGGSLQCTCPPKGQESLRPMVQKYAEENDRMKKALGAIWDRCGVVNDCPACQDATEIARSVLSVSKTDGETDG